MPFKDFFLFLSYDPSEPIKEARTFAMNYCFGGKSIIPSRMFGKRKIA